MSENAIIPHDPNMGIEPIDEQEIRQRAPDWYDHWRARIRAWVAKNTDHQAADILLLVPDMFALIMRLARDQRVPFLVKGQLLLAAAYVLSPVDLIPEALVGAIGLTEDAGVMALVLMWISGIGGIDKSVLTDNWSGSSDVNETITGVHKKVTENADRLFSPEVWKQIRKRFDRSTPPNVVEGKAKRRLPRINLRRGKKEPDQSGIQSEGE